MILPIQCLDVVASNGHNTLKKPQPAHICNAGKSNETRYAYRYIYVCLCVYMNNTYKRTPPKYTHMICRLARNTPMTLTNTHTHTDAYFTVLACALAFSYTHQIRTHTHTHHLCTFVWFIPVLSFCCVALVSNVCMCRHDTNNHTCTHAHTDASTTVCVNWSANTIRWACVCVLSVIGHIT